MSVWITGLGAVSGAGNSVAEALATFRAGKPNPSDPVPFETEIICPTFRVRAELAELEGRWNRSRSLRLAMMAARRRWGMRVWRIFPAGGWEFVLGSTVACQLNNIPFYDAYRRGNNPPMDAIENYLHSNLGEAVSRILNLNGPHLTIANACSSGADAIGAAASWIRAGLCDLAIAGGADELNRVALAGFWSLGVVSSQPCAPFDRDRAGLHLGEGAGVVVLESESHAVQRGKKCNCRLAGFGAACDAHHLTAPHPEGRGLEAAIAAALKQAGISATEIAFINAHGTATSDNDRVEAKVFHRIFGNGCVYLSTKGHTGHTLGAAGGLEAVFTVLGLQHGWIPASAGFAQSSEEIPIAPIRERTEIRGRFAMSTSLAFGGNNAAIVIERSP